MLGRYPRPGVLFTAACLGPVAAAGWALQRLARGSQARGVALTAAATWMVLGAASLAAEAAGIQRALAVGDLDAARRRLPALCGRDRDRLDEPGIARATVEPVAENTGDAMVTRLFWGAVAGIPGPLAYRAVDTLGAMAGHRSTWYERFGWVAARLTVLLTVALAHWADGSGRQALRALLRDGAVHPSPNAGRCEAAFAGALCVRLGGTSVYHGFAERGGQLGDGRAPAARDIGRAVLFSRLVTAMVASAAAWLPGGRAQWPGGAIRAPAGRRWPR